MTDRIASDGVLTDEQRRSLDLLLNMIIPPNSERGMPGAAEVDLIAYVNEFAGDSLVPIQGELDALNEKSHDKFDISFSELAEADREALVEQLRSSRTWTAQSIVVQTMACYYQDDRVVAALGMEPGPPFPSGNEVVSGDLSLLDPVRKRPKLYRE